MEEAERRYQLLALERGVIRRANTKSMQYIPEIINHFIDKIDVIDTELLVFVLFLMKRINQQKFTPALTDLYVIIEVELTKRAVDLSQL